MYEADQSDGASPGHGQLPQRYASSYHEAQHRPHTPPPRRVSCAYTPYLYATTYIYHFDIPYNMLSGTGPRGGAWGFKLEVLTKLSDTKTTDGKRCVCHRTLLHCLAPFFQRKRNTCMFVRVHTRTHNIDR